MRPIVVNKQKATIVTEPLRIRLGILEAIHKNLKLAVEKYQKALKSVNVSNYIGRIKEEVKIPVIYDYDKFMTKVFPSLLDNYSDLLFKGDEVDILKGFTQFDDKFYPKRSYYNYCSFFTYKSISFDKYVFVKDLVENIFGIPTNEQSIYLPLAMSLFTDFKDNTDGIISKEMFKVNDLKDISQFWSIKNSTFVNYKDNNVDIECSYVHDYPTYSYRDNGDINKKSIKLFSLYNYVGLEVIFQLKVYKGVLYLTLPLKALVSSIYDNDVNFEGYFQSNNLLPSKINEINKINQKLSIPKEYNPLDIEDKEQRFEAIVKVHELFFRRLFNV